MAFTLKKGRSVIENWPIAASQVVVAGDLVYMGGSGTVIPADSTSGDHIGIALKTIATTDSDYAVAKSLPVLKAYADNVYEVDVDTGTALTAAMVGNQYDLTDANSLNVGATSKKVVTIVGFISATKALVKINAIIENVHVVTS